MSEKIQITTGKKQKLSALYSYPEEGTGLDHRDTLVIMTHGFPGYQTGHNDLFGDIEFILAEKKYHTLRFDFSGCGESDGKEENFTITSACEDFHNVLFWAKKKQYTQFVYIGEGLGASLAIMNADVNVKAFIFLWPLLDMAAHGNKIYKEAYSNNTIDKTGYLNYDDYRISLNFIHELSKTKLDKKLKEISNPTLILHGAKDKEIPVSKLNIIRNNISSKRIEITTFHDGEHGLQKLAHRKMIFHHISQFIENNA